MFCPECGTWNRTRAAVCHRCHAELPELESAPEEKPDDEISALRVATGNRYRIVRKLGSGGMANVYYAEHAQLRRPLVVKVLHQHLAKDNEMRERFRREAEAASQLEHPHICTIEDFGEQEDCVYLVMPYLRGGSLAGKMQKDKSLPTPFSVQCAAQTANALDYAHRRGVIHRDVKPDNILFDEDGNAILTDFGIATARFHGRLTASGRAMGTPHYMSPEQAMGKMVDGRSDLYAVGVMIYECILGFPPFDGADSYSVGYKHVHENAVPPETVDSRIPTQLSNIVMKCLAKQPDQRYQRGNELADALVAFLGSTPAPTPESRLARLSRKIVPTPSG